MNGCQVEFCFSFEKRMGKAIVVQAGVGVRQGKSVFPLLQSNDAGFSSSIVMENGGYGSSREARGVSSAGVGFKLLIAVWG